MDKSEEMFKLVGEWRKSDINQSEFCKPHGITVAKFGYWAGKEDLSRAGIAEKSAALLSYQANSPHQVNPIR